MYFMIEGVPRFWVKYGDEISSGETLTQNQVAQIVKLRPRERRARP